MEDVRTRDLSQEEATHRLSFLADIVDSEGYAIKGASNSSMREDLVAEANATSDMFETYQSGILARAVNQNKVDRHAEAIREMREAIDRNETTLSSSASIQGHEKVLSPQSNGIIELANNPDFSVATIAKEANRINGRAI